MDWAYWIFFVSGMGALLFTPGPTILTVSSFTVRYGRAAVGYLVAGVAVADLIYMSFGLALYTGLISLNVTLFFALRVFGLIYVLLLAWRFWHAGPLRLRQQSGAAGDQVGWHISLKIFIVTITNPKGVLFLTSILPNFIPLEGVSFSHGAMMILVFNGLSALNIVLWGTLSARALSRFVAWPHVGKVSALILLTAVALVWGLDYVG